MEVQIIVPGNAESSGDAVSLGLVALTKALDAKGLADGSAGGIFGGEFGYGANYENDVFMLHRYCWCEQADCPWCMGCRCPDENWVPKAGHKYPVKVKWTCDYCTGGGVLSRFAWKDGGPFHRDGFYNPPLFWHKPSDSRVRWYKYIGRGMEVRLTLPWHEIYVSCIASLEPTP